MTSLTADEDDETGRQHEEKPRGYVGPVNTRSRARQTLHRRYEQQFLIMVIGVLCQRNAHHVRELRCGGHLDEGRHPSVRDFFPARCGPPGEDLRVVGGKVVTAPDVAKRSGRPHCRQLGFDSADA